MFKGAPLGDGGIELGVEEDALLKVEAPVEQRWLGRRYPSRRHAIQRGRRDEGGVFSPSGLFSAVVLEFKAFPRKEGITREGVFHVEVSHMVIEVVACTELVVGKHVGAPVFGVLAFGGLPEGASDVISGLRGDGDSRFWCRPIGHSCGKGGSFATGSGKAGFGSTALLFLVEKSLFTGSTSLLNFKELCVAGLISLLAFGKLKLAGFKLETCGFSLRGSLSL